MAFAWVSLTYLDEADFISASPRASGDRRDHESAAVMRASSADMLSVAFRSRDAHRRAALRGLRSDDWSWRSRARHALAQSPQLPTADRPDEVRLGSGRRARTTRAGSGIRTAASTWCSATSIETTRKNWRFPPGPDNTVEPGGPDRGQPTYFLPRRRARLFRVRVPADLGTEGADLDDHRQRPHREGVRRSAARPGNQRADHHETAASTPATTIPTSRRRSPSRLAAASPRRRARRSR